MHLVVLVQGNLFQSHFGADEVRKLFGRNLAQSLKARNFGVGTQLGDGFLPFVFVVSIARAEVVFAFALHQSCIGSGNHLLALNLCSAVSYAEQGRLQHVDVAFLHQFGEELQEESDD